MDITDLWGEEVNNRLQIAKIRTAIGQAASPRCGMWAYGPAFEPNTNVVKDMPRHLADIRLSAGDSWLDNTAFSVVKITFITFRRNDAGQDHYLITTNYGNGTIFGANMVMNGIPSTASTNSAYSLDTQTDPHMIRIHTTNHQVGKTSNPASGWLKEGVYQIVVWDGASYHVMRVPERYNV